MTTEYPTELMMHLSNSINSLVKELHELKKDNEKMTELLVKHGIFKEFKGNR